MSARCYPVTMLPHLTRLYRDYLAWGDREEESAGERNRIAGWYGARPGSLDWAQQDVPAVDAAALAEALLEAPAAAGYGPAALRNVKQLRQGARAVVTGQQVGLLGGPLLCLLKAATAVARARQAEDATGIAHVPVFWLATEDHDLAEVNQVSLAGKRKLQTLRVSGVAATGGEVGAVALGDGIAAVLEEACGMLAYAPVTGLLEEAYGAAGATFGSAFALWMTRLFAAHGLIVMDASTRAFHRLGAPALRYAVEHAAELEAALLARSAELESLGFHAQVLVKPGSSLLFLVSEGVRLALRRTGDGQWKAGARSYSTAELLEVLDRDPERVSPNALLRPVFQDTMLPVAAYIGGPAEIAYFAQSEVIYRAILGRVTPVLPRFSATLLEPEMAGTMARHELDLPDLVAAGTVDALALRLGARAMPIEGKRQIAAAGNALDTELSALTGYMSAMDSSLGRSAEVAASKMRYQMNRLRRMSASFELQKQAVLGRQAESIMLHLYPGGHPQERVLAGVQLLASAGEQYLSVIDRLVTAAADLCPGHSLLEL